MSKYLKVMFGNKGANYEYKIDEVNITNVWNPKATSGKDFGGFNFSVEDKIIRWLHRGDTLYDVIIPDDTEVIDCVESATPHGVFRSNKIIITNPRKVTDEMALEFYKKSNIPEIAYYKAMGGCALMNYRKTSMAILRNKVNENNIDLVLKEWNDFINHGGSDDRKGFNETINLIGEYLKEIKSDLLISISIDKEPYIKKITNDNIINITGESGSGKSTYTNKWLSDDNYIVIDTDEIMGDKPTSNKNCLEFREYLKDKYKDHLPNRNTEFNIIYKDILEYYKNTKKTLVIDSAQFRNLVNEDDLKLIKGKMIIIRTCIDTCLNRCINRWKKDKSNYTSSELQAYIDRKPLHKWYKSLNTFIENIDRL